LGSTFSYQLNFKNFRKTIPALSKSKQICNGPQKLDSVLRRYYKIKRGLKIAIFAKFQGKGSFGGDKKAETVAELAADINSSHSDKERD
jgi:hypothetical protein